MSYHNQYFDVPEKAEQTISLHYLESFILKPGVCVNIEFPIGVCYMVSNNSETESTVVVVDGRGHLNFCKLKMLATQSAPLRIAVDPWADMASNLR